MSKGDAQSCCCDEKLLEGSGSHSKHKNGELRKKEYALSESVLTDLSQKNEHYQAIEHIISAALLCMAVSAIVSDYCEKKSLSTMLAPKLEFLKIVFTNWEIGASLWLKMMALTLAFFPLVRLWTRKRPCGTTVTRFDRLCVLAFFGYLTYIISLTYDMFFRNPILGYGVANAISLEQLRLMAKMYSFAREISRKIFSPSASDSKKNDGDPITTKEFPSFRSYLYFLFAPTLVYREKYPRTPSINWGQFFHHILQFLGALICFYWMFEHYLVTEFYVYAANQSSITTEMMVLTTLRTLVPGTFMYLLFFYGFFQSWHNAWAELLRFGDRLFYLDFWNASDFGEFLRKWNLIVHDWLYTYIYKESHDLLKTGRSKLIPSMLAFGVSSAFHEYYISATQRYFFPVMLINLSIGCNISIFIKMKDRGRFNNIYLWTSIFLAWGIMFSFYFFEMTARILCPNVTADHFDNAFLAEIAPHFLYCFGK